ncbi:NAD(P)H-binding protein [Portibacter lacus]|uniref:NAD(P)-binding domain-containing protein n=1 Tax=Portibacter lacus TaxID=1099794 RepID=A0AA37SQY9_9BACT|nr:NAD(P)H-binding protein [Portibacter lacus]GLR17151.1 hypothetical protein GCM10007940_17660 [Portibacter lacus]
MKAIVIGATGLVGSSLVEQLITNESYDEIRILHRRTTGFEDAKIKESVIDFDQPESFRDKVKGDVLFSALGTTMKTAGSKEAQYKVDYEYQYEVAKMAAEKGVPTYVLVSSSGADSSSSIFYTRMKGELEDAVLKLPFKKVILLQPSVLDGDRQEKRLGEKVGIVVGKLLAWVPGIRKYRPIHVDVVAQGMINSVDKSPLGTTVYKLDEIFAL